MHTEVTHQFSHVQIVNADELHFPDVGALEVQEVGFIGHCSCGWQTLVRYSEVAAQAAVLEHTLGPDSFASLGSDASSPGGSTSRVVVPASQAPAARDTFVPVSS